MSSGSTSKPMTQSPKAIEPIEVTSGDRPRSPESESASPPATAPAPTAAMSQPSPVASSPSTLLARAGIMMMYGNPKRLITAARNIAGPIAACRRT